jgi:hypothetical protein
MHREVLRGLGSHGSHRSGVKQHVGIIVSVAIERTALDLETAWETTLQRVQVEVAPPMEK